MKEDKIEVDYIKIPIQEYKDLLTIRGQYLELKELKEKVHELLDKNGIARAYQIMIDKYFNRLLEES